MRTGFYKVVVNSKVFDSLLSYKHKAIERPEIPYNIFTLKEAFVYLYF